MLELLGIVFWAIILVVAPAALGILVGRVTDSLVATAAMTTAGWLVLLSLGLVGEYRTKKREEARGDD